MPCAVSYLLRFLRTLSAASKQVLRIIRAFLHSARAVLIMQLLFLIHQPFRPVKQLVRIRAASIPQIAEGGQFLLFLFQALPKKFCLPDKFCFLHFRTDHNKFISADPVKLVFREILPANLRQMTECLIPVFMTVGIV